MKYSTKHDNKKSLRPVHNEIKNCCPEPTIFLGESLIIRNTIPGADNWAIHDNIALVLRDELFDNPTRGNTYTTQLHEGGQRG